VTAASDPHDQRSSPPARSGIDLPFLRATTELEQDGRLDAVASALARPARVVGGPDARRVLGGEWLGHALHPFLTDLPLGCWISAGLLDLLSGRRARTSAQRLVGLGILFALPAATTGLSDWSAESTPEVKRVGALHAALNGAALASYVWSWSLRRRGHHALGVASSLVGAGTVMVSGYLGGHMTLKQGVGVSGSTRST